MPVRACMSPLCEVTETIRHNLLPIFKPFYGTIHGPRITTHNIEYAGPLFKDLYSTHSCGKNRLLKNRLFPGKYFTVMR